MQKHLKNEAGYTLILVLLIITLFFIFSITLMGNLLNSSAQNNKTEEKIQEENLMQMGVSYVERLIAVTDQEVKKDTRFKIGNTDNETYENYQTVFKKLLETSKTVEVENNKFKYEITGYKGLSKDEAEAKKDDKFTIEYSIILNDDEDIKHETEKEITISIQ